MTRVDRNVKSTNSVGGYLLVSLALSVEVTVFVLCDHKSTSTRQEGCRCQTSFFVKVSVVKAEDDLLSLFFRNCSKLGCANNIQLIE